MPSKQDWETLEALRNSSKGRLQYNREWSSEGINESTVVLSEYAAWILDNVINRTEPDSSPVERLPSQDDSVPAAHTEPGNQRSEVPRTEAESLSKLQMDKLMEVEGSILLFEKAHKMKVKEHLQARVDMCDQFSKSMAEKSAEQLKRFEEMMELKQRQEKHQLLELLEKGSKEALGQQEKLKEEHRHRAKLLTLKLREAEQQRQQEIERIRQEEGRERMRRLCSLQQEVLQLVQKIQVDYKQQEALRVDLSSYGHRGNQICGMLSSVIRSSSERGYPTQDDVNLGERSLQEMQMLASTIVKELAAAEQRKKAEEEVVKEKQKEAQLQAQQQQQQQQATPQTPAPAQDSKQGGLPKKVSNSTLQRYLELQTGLEQCHTACEDLATCKDPQTKKIRANLQRAVTIPVSQISSVSGSQVRDTFEKINNFLMGKPVVFAGQKILVSQHPLGQDFVCLKLAEKLVNQGEEEVASHHESAFPIAYVASALWERYPKVGELFLANLHKKCPYTVPLYPPFKKGTSLMDYQRLMGYQVKDSIVEQQDSFLKRMSGMVRLYAAVMQVRWPYGTSQGNHPHGLNNGWHWFAQMLNMEPLSDITATLLFDFLEVCGNAMIKQYRDQFWKLLILIKDHYFPKIGKITTGTEMGSASRLKHFLEEAVRRKDIPLPKGYLQPSFWRT
ncbi:nucleoporin GLE1 [Bufo gargarizans]|uniref:nucleoporin GLE1 n=1 Tax=Bufo gargarizans TaxID=30331 RepID=UPI001CF5B5B7|nr:nucleoporin GLE1 [Bufo gargarizans]